MKKFLAIVLTICMLAGVICLPTMAAEPAAGVVLRISALKRGETNPVVIGDYTSFEDGWNAAMALADNRSEMNNKKYDRVVVDLYADWKAVDGNFTDDSDNGPGFDWDTIYFPAGVRVTLNMNGHTIDRAMTTWEYDGEVMSVDDDVDLIINDGTIKGGWSCNGAGGIHIENDARVTLNNVHIVGNKTTDDDGGGIQLIGESILVMNGGSFQSNELLGIWGGITGTSTGAAIYVNDSTATFNSVEFKNNMLSSEGKRGTAIGAIDSQITLSKCTFEGNSYEEAVTYSDSSIIYADDSFLTVTDSTFGNNTANRIFMLDGSVLTMENSVLSNITDTDSLIRAKSSSSLYITNTIFTDNDAHVVSGTGWKSDITEDSFLRNCTVKSSSDYSTFYRIKSPLTFYDCDLGNSSFDELSREYTQIVNSATPDGKIVLRVNALKKDGTTVAYGEFTVFDDGWNTAMRLASNSTLMRANDYDRIVVDLDADWNADDGQFTDDYDNGPGFDWDTISFPENARVTLNMNGHTINRGLTKCDSDGEVMYVDVGTDVIINDGTITGGFSDNGAGGIHIKSEAKVTLNNVHVDGNKVENDDGAGIAVNSDAELIMNGGSLSDNVAQGESWGALYVNDATVTLNSVMISGNEGKSGLAVYADSGNVTMNDCIVENNGIEEKLDHSYTLFLIVDHTSFTINGGAIRNNGNPADPLYALIDLGNVDLTVTGQCKITGNHAKAVFSKGDGYKATCLVDHCEITDNDGMVTVATNVTGSVSMPDTVFRFTNCKFNNNNVASLRKTDFDAYPKLDMTMTDCDLGDSTFTGKEYITFVDTSAPHGTTASLFGEGSLTMIVALVALVCSVVSISMSVASNKKKTAPATEGED